MQDEYETKILDIATFLLANKVIFKRVRRDMANPKQGIFIFEDVMRCDQLEKAFNYGEASDRMIDAKEIIEARKRLQSELYYNVG
jgi:hypothetical protein